MIFMSKNIDNSGSLSRGNNGRDFNASQIAIKPRIKSIQVSTYQKYKMGMIMSMIMYQFAVIN